LTRAQVLQIGLATLFLGGFGYVFFRFIGFQDVSAGIASEAVLIGIILIWTLSYILRVITGKMTFMEQRKRYRDAYEKITEEELQSRFDSLSEEDQMRLIKDIENDKKS
tara:strand:- start:1556 stop:1882 length:327 start_codon:yes stop_codon:yes gene_type:complete